MTGGVAGLFKANGVEWVKGYGKFKDANTIAVEGGEDVTFKSAIVATGSFPMRPPIPGLESDLCVDSTGLLAQTEVPKRLVILGGGIIGAEFASIFNRFGTEVTIIEMLDTLIPQEDADAAKELGKQFGKRGITLQLGKQCTGVEQQGNSLKVHFGDGETVDCDLMLVSVGRAPLVEGLGLEAAGVEFDKRTGITTDEHRRTTVPHIYAVGDCAGYWQLAHTAFREGEVAAENAWDTMRSSTTARCRGPIYTDPEIAGVGLTEAQAREQYGDEVAVGVFPWVANARAVMQARDRRLGQVDPRDALRRAARHGHGRPARHRPDRGRHGRDRRRVDGRDGRRRHGRAPDARRGDQGSRSRRARPRDPPAEPQESRREGLATSVPGTGHGRYQVPDLRPGSPGSTRPNSSEGRPVPAT